MTKIYGNMKIGDKPIKIDKKMGEKSWKRIF